jgi:hypothetical protein
MTMSEIAQTLGRIIGMSIDTCGVVETGDLTPAG